MGKFVENNWYEVIHCASCAVGFGLPADFIQRRRDDHARFYCPSGHVNFYGGQTEAQKLASRLARAEASLATAQSQSASLRVERDQVARAHKRMRTRVMNGVCPCCNRSFENLRQHMQTQHAEFGKEQTFKALREAFGMTQAEVAREAGVVPAYISLFENSKPVPGYAADRLTTWAQKQGAA